MRIAAKLAILNKWVGRKVMNITQEIDDIITQRKRRLPIVRNKRQQIEKIKECVQRLELICQEANSGGDKYGELFKQYPEVQERLRLINTKEFNDAYIKISEILKKLEIRFLERKYILVLLVAGQGKSLVMQNISGLSGSVIPSADGADCTGAKSIITNRNEDGVSAEIRFLIHKVNILKLLIDIYMKYLIRINLK